MHEYRKATAAVASGEMTSAAIAIHQYETALYQLPAGSEGVTGGLTFAGCTNPTGTFASIVDSNGDAVTATVVAGSWQPIRSGLFGMPYIKIVNASAQSTARTITVTGHAPR